MIKTPVWVKCLSCGKKWYLEEYGKRFKCGCPVCNSIEYEIDHEYDGQRVKYAYGDFGKE